MRCEKGGNNGKNTQSHTDCETDVLSRYWNRPHQLQYTQLSHAQSARARERALRTRMAAMLNAGSRG